MRWKERIVEVVEAGEALIETRLAILREELSGKAVSLSKGLVALAAAFALGVGGLLLFAGLLVAVFTGLLKSVAFGVLAAFLLYAAATVVFARIGWSALSSVRPFEFPATREELSRDLEAVSARGEEETNAAGEDTEEAGPSETDEVEDLEERLRAGAE